MRQLHNPSISTDSLREEADRAGEVIDGRYRLERLIACGGSGMIYLATELASQQRAAIKLITTRLKHFDPELAERFREDAQRCARLIHPSVAMVYDYGETDHGDLFIAMEYVDGRPLAQVIAVEGPLEIERILRIAVRIARALKHTHDLGVLHGDLKPSKALLVGDQLDDDRLKLVDVGVAGLLTGERGRWGIADSQDSPFGSPKYLSPEQIRGESLDARSDMYAFGAVLFCMITGVPPFLGSRAVEIAEQHLRVRPPPMESVGYKRRVPHPVFAIVSRCLEKQRENRFSSMAQVITELKISYQASVGRPLILDEPEMEDVDEGSGHTPLPLSTMDPREPFSLEAVMTSKTVTDDDSSLRERRLQTDLAEAMRMAKRLPPERVRSGREPVETPVQTPVMLTQPPIRTAPPVSMKPSITVPVIPTAKTPPSLPAIQADADSGAAAAAAIALSPEIQASASLPGLPAPTVSITSLQPAAHASPIVINTLPSRAPWIIAAISLLTAIAAVASLIFGPARTSPQPSPDPAISEDIFDECKIAFDSEPRGARVEEQGVILGITPFVRAYPRGLETRHFVFILDGYERVERNTSTAAEKMALRVVMPPREKKN